MRITHFRIKNFRSIVDTRWKSFSPDGVTALVGKNESGKSAILDALAATFSSVDISKDDLRYDSPLPEISFKIELDQPNIENNLLHKLHPNDAEKVLRHLENNNFTAILDFCWTENKASDLEHIIDLNAPELSVPMQEPLSKENEFSDWKETFLSKLIADYLFQEAPYYDIFKADTGLLPDTIDIDEKFQLSGPGKSAVKNLLNIVDISTQELIKINDRNRHSKISKAISTLNQDLQKFWNQTIGSSDQIKVEFTLDHYSFTTEGKAGKPYLSFWVSDGIHKLHPKQRSAGVRWFLSFYLQLRSSQKSQQKLHLLLDEPGANLHINAQQDILKLINTLSPEIQITYTTHSPALIEHEKLYRVYAVQRKHSSPETPTELFEAHHLSSASSDTLSPILAAIGTDLTYHQSIQRENNILLEEISGFYYINAFWDLSEKTPKPNFIAATGVNKIQMFANMFIGWGLDFGIVMDDDSQGRKVYESLKRTLWGDCDETASRKMYKIKDCMGIEDIFDPIDFNRHVLGADLDLTNTPCQTLKRTKHSKPVLAYNFGLKVKNKEITSSDLSEKTLENIEVLISKISKLI